MNSYMTSILTACVIFPLVAAVFTLPFVIVHYRRYGGIPVIRVMIVYSFILYSMCALFLTVLPLPKISAVAAMKPKPVGLMPFKDLIEAFEKAGFVLNDLSSFKSIAHWRRLASSFELFQILANIVMQIPLGIYLRYYFRCSWKKTLLIGLAVSLFYELTQLTGLWFIYPKAYRYAEVDDLINNTLGAMIGYWITPLFGLFLPKRDEIDRLSYTQGLYATLARRFFAYLFDIIILSAVNSFFAGNLNKAASKPWFITAWVASIILLLGVVPKLCMDSTIGQLLVRLRVKKEDGVSEISFFAQLIRNLLLYYVETDMLVLGGIFLGLSIFIMSYTDNPLEDRVLWLAVFGAVPVLILWFFAHCHRKHRTLPHSYYTRSSIVPIPVSVKIHKDSD